MGFSFGNCCSGKQDLFKSTKMIDETNDETTNLPIYIPSKIIQPSRVVSGTILKCENQNSLNENYIQINRSNGQK